MKKKESAGPEFVRYFGPLLEALHHLGGSGRPSEVRNLIAEQVELSDDKRAETIASGGSRFENQVAFARLYLAKAEYIESSQRGVWSLTEKGRNTTKLHHEDALALFRKIHSTFVRKPINGKETPVEPELPVVDPLVDPVIESSDYRSQLMSILRQLPPIGFEHLCQRLLREAGFEQVVVTKASGDGGIDGHGILQINPLVSFRVVFQCKRYSGSVSAPQVNEFRGAALGRSEKAIMITTGTFTRAAQQESKRDGIFAVELIDGELLLDMFERLELGLKPRKTFDVDLGFFDEFSHIKK
jgi:restriction system protein